MKRAKNIIKEETKGGQYDRYIDKEKERQENECLKRAKEDKDETLKRPRETNLENEYYE